MSTIVTTSYKNPGTVIANGQTTGNGWTNPNNILIVDDAVAESNPSAASDIIIGNYPFAVPTDAVITGIEFRIRANRGAQTSPDPTITIYAVNNESGEDVFTPYTAPLSGLTPDLAWYDLGAPTYLFDQAWTVDQINNLKLQLIGNVDIYVDAVPARVSYYVPDPSPTPDPVGENGENCNSQVQALPFSLKLPFNVGDDVVYFNSFNLPNGEPIENADLGDFGGAFAFTVEPGIAAGNGNSFMENFAALKADVQDVIGAVKFNVLFRGIDFVTPFGPKTDNQSSHGVGSSVILTNNGYYEDRWLKKCHIGVLVSAPITVEDEDVPLPDPAEIFDFQGAGVIAQNDLSNTKRKKIIIPGAGGSTPPAVGTTSTGSSGSTPVESISFEVTNTGINRGTLMRFEIASTSTPTDVRVGGDPATQIKTSTAAGKKLETWLIVAPLIGTQEVVITLDIPSVIVASATPLFNMAQTSTVGTTSNDSGTGTTASTANTTSQNYSLVFDLIGTQDAPIIYTVGAGQSQDFQLTAITDTLQAAGSYQPAGLTPDTVVMSWGLSKSAAWAMTSVEIKGITTTVPGSGQSAIQFENEGVNLGVSGTVDEVDFTGAGVTASRVGNKITVNVPNPGSGGASSFTAIAGEDINVGGGPLAVFVGYQSNVKTIQDVTGSLGNFGTYDTTGPGSPGVGSTQVNGFRYACSFVPTQDVTINTMGYEVNADNDETITVTIKLDTDNAGVPSGSPFLTQVATVFRVSGTDTTRHLRFDTSVQLQNGVTYWVDIEFPADPGNDIDIFQTSGGTSMLSWNGSAWVATGLNRLGLTLQLAPYTGEVYKALDETVFDSGGNTPPAGGAIYGRGRFIGYVNQTYAKDAPITVIHDGEVGIFSSLASTVEGILYLSDATPGGTVSVAGTIITGHQIDTTKLTIARNDIPYQ